MALKFKNNVEKLVDYSVESQFKREDRLRGHVSSFFAASSIVLVAETTLFTVLSTRFLEVCTFMWYLSIALLILQILLIVICYIILFPSNRTTIGSPSELYEWYMKNFKELELEQANSENPEENNNAKKDEKDDIAIKMLEAETDMYKKIYDTVKKDVDSGYHKLRAIQIISIVLVAAYSHITLIMCFLKLFKK